jgi:hypothetical protein
MASRKASEPVIDGAEAFLNQFHRCDVTRTTDLALLDSTVGEIDFQLCGDPFERRFVSAAGQACQHLLDPGVTFSASTENNHMHISSKMTDLLVC